MNEVRLRVAGQRSLTFLPQRPQEGYLRQEEPAFDEEGAFTAAATVRPLSTQVYGATYGERVQRMLLVLVDMEVPAKEGMGVRVEAAEGADYRVAAPPERWARHQRVLLERL